VSKQILRNKHELAPVFENIASISYKTEAATSMYRTIQDDRMPHRIINIIQIDEPATTRKSFKHHSISRAELAHRTANNTSGHKNRVMIANNTYMPGEALGPVSHNRIRSNLAPSRVRRQIDNSIFAKGPSPPKYLGSKVK
jgi:hypothetical protein